MKKQNYTTYLRKSFIQYAMVLLVSMALLVAVFFLFDYYVFVIRQNESSNKEIAAQFRSEYARYLTEVESLSKGGVLSRYLKTKRPVDRYALSEELYAFANAGEIRARFLLLDENGDVVVSNFTTGNQQLFTDSLFVKRILSRLDADSPDTVALLCDVDLGSDQPCAYTFARAIRDGSRVTGSLFLNMRSDDLETLAGSVKEEIILLDRYDNAIYSSIRLPEDPGDKLPTRRFTQDIERNGIYEINDVAMYTRHTHLEEAGIDLYTLTSVESRMRTYRMAAVFFLLTLLVVGILMVLMARLYAGIGERSVNDLMRDLEVKNLEEQFNPHFVFNVMESVYFQIDEDPKKAQEMLMAFSTLMRYSINHGQSKVRLETDIDYLNDFLMLQKIRYNNLLSYRFDIPDELLDCMVPKLLMQPIIENSIRHGFTTGQELRIDITGRQEQDALILEVRDDGIGITEERLREIEESFREEISDKTVRHIGLYNAEKVLQVLYGDTYGLTITSAPGEGTLVTLRLPYEVEEDDV